ncbi:MAG: cytochrome c oxidase subunit II [Acidobacteriota bacterium]
MGRQLPLFPERASSLAASVDALVFTSLGIAVFFGLLIAILIVGFAIKFRRRSRHEVGRAYKAPTSLEIAWTVLPLVISLGMFAWGAEVFWDASTPPADATEYGVVGKQWMWKFQHPEGRREIDELHVPVGKAIKLKMISEDVIHSFFVPAFRTKADVLPGRYSTTWFRAIKPGTYHLFCAEYCGAEHSRMIGRVVVMEPHDYEVWLAGIEAGKSPEQTGEALFTKLACNTCHRNGDQQRGPRLEGLLGSTVHLKGGGTVVADEAYVRESIVRPNAKVTDGFEPIMPTFEGQVSEDGIMALIAYIKAQSPPEVKP